MEEFKHYLRQANSFFARCNSRMFTEEGLSNLVEDQLSRDSSNFWNKISKMGKRCYSSELVSQNIYPHSPYSKHIIDLKKSGGIHKTA